MDAIRAALAPDGAPRGAAAARRPEVVLRADTLRARELVASLVERVEDLVAATARLDPRVSALLDEDLSAHELCRRLGEAGLPAALEFNVERAASNAVFFEELGDATRGALERDEPDAAYALFLAGLAAGTAVMAEPESDGRAAATFVEQFPELRFS